MGGEERAWIPMRDGVRLAAILYRPADDEPAPVLLEALPYRMDDLTSSYGSEYERLRDEGGFAVARVDLRGTGSSGGIATDEYPPAEQADLHEVIAWLASQPWSTGRVGMFGTSYSGFNSIQMAMERPPALGAVVAIYATDDRFTDDVHYTGGARRALDLVDYVLYMAAMNALPPVPAVAGPGWREQWMSRLADGEPWLLRWFEEQHDGPYWRHGSLRPGYDRITCPTMLVGGWADGYRNACLRTLAALAVPKRLILGPWSHMSPATSVPGPHIDLVPEMISWFGRWLRDDPDDGRPPIAVYRRRWDPPAPDLPVVRGEWGSENEWPPTRLRTMTLAVDDAGRDSLVVEADVGVEAWISCAGRMPWGQPSDQRTDDARSLTYDWPVEAEVEILGHPRLRVRVTASAPVAHLSAKLCAVARDGRSALVSRGYTTFATDGDAEADVDLELDATSWIFEPGYRIRLSLAGSDWPNLWPPPVPATLTVDRASLAFDLPVLHGPSPVPPPTFPAPASCTIEPADPVAWRIERDVLGRRTAAVVDHGSAYAAAPGAQVTEHYVGRVDVSTHDPGDATAQATSRFEIAWPEVAAAAEARLHVQSDAGSFDVTVDVVAEENGIEIFHRTWHRTFPRG